MREIKFRAWNSKTMLNHNSATIILGTKYWLYTNSNTHKVLDSGVGEIIIRDSAYEQKGHILMQYIGLKDKNGKEAYESDIIKCGNEIGVIYYNAGYFAFAGCVMGADELSDGEFEIIGNKYQDSELLK